MKANRLDLLEEYIIARGSATLPELSENFNVSINTIRRDIAELLQRGTIRKVYGGVTANDTAVTPISIRETTNSMEKERIGELAAQLIHDGDTIFLDSGSTTPYLLRWLEGKSSLTVISHNLKVIEAAARCRDIHLIALGGEYSHRTNDFSGVASSAESLSRYHISKAFLAATAVSVRFGLANTSFLQAEMKRRVAAASDCVILVADHSKFSRNAAITFCPFESLSAVVTDCRPDDAFVSACEARKIQLLY